MNILSKTLSFILLLALNGVSQAKEKLYFFTEQYPPYNMSDDGSAFAHKAEDISGLCTDIVKAVLKEVPYQSRIKLRNWRYGLDRTTRKPNTGLFCAVRSEDREALFDWVGPITDLRWTLFAKPGSDITLNTLEDARAYTIGGYKGDVMSNYLISKGFKVVLADSSQMVPRKLELNQVDLWVTDQLTGPYTAANVTEMESLKEVLTFRSTPMYIAMNKETPEKVINSLQQALDALRQQGELQSIEAAYGR
ncbi:MAG: transporter substrate-binding domain-containing protein [Saccharospirillaceae bacterium]|nr:transporter substrate-binding domain-containing protein [Saccharospirillaceae bacterium]